LLSRAGVGEALRAARGRQGAAGSF